MPYTPYYLNPILAAAWAEFERVGKEIIVRAAKRCGISPLNPNAENFQGSAVSAAYDLIAADKKEALAIWKKVHGDEHPQVATGLNNLAGLLKVRGSTTRPVVEPT